MKVYYAVVDNRGTVIPGNGTVVAPGNGSEEEARGLAARFDVKYPKDAPFRAVCFVDAEAVSHVLNRLADRVPEDAPAARMLRATALAFSADADDDAAWERVVFG